MKKVVRLTESQLISLVKKVIKEQGESDMINPETFKKDFIGKTVTFYKTEEDAMTAFNAKKSNPHAIGSVIGKIKDINKIDADGALFVIDLINLDSTDESGNYIDYNRQNGVFVIRGFDKGPYFSETLKRVIDNKFYNTDFASKQNPNGTQANMA